MATKDRARAASGLKAQASGLRRIAGVVLACVVAFGASQTAAQGARQAMQQDPACQVLTPASTGGPLPKDPSTAVIRWLGHTNYELVYQGNVFLLDAYYERVPRSHPIGVAPRDFTRATAVFVGHPHFDHMSDAASVARQASSCVPDCACQVICQCIQLCGCRCATTVAACQ